MKELAVKQNTDIVQHAGVSQSERLMTAILEGSSNPEFDVQKMTAMYDLYDRVRKEDAKIAYYRDKALMQEEMPEMPKNGRGHKDIPFVKYDDAVPLLKPIFSKYGFSYSAPIKSIEGDMVLIECTLSHRDGHRETTILPLPRDEGGHKNAVQAVGSTIQYARRYGLFSLANIAAEGEDDDGQKSGKPVLEMHISKLMAHNEALRDNLQTMLVVKDALAVDDYSTAFEAMNELDDQIKADLWLAPSKGGILNTEERGKIKSDDWSQARKDFFNEDA